MAHKYVVVVPNQPEIVNQLTRLLSEEGVNIDSLHMETLGEIVSFRFVVDQDNGLRQTLESEGFHISENKVFRMDLPNRPGELDQLTRRLADQKVALRYLYGTFHGKTTKVDFAVDRPEDVIAIVKELNQR